MYDPQGRCVKTSETTSGSVTERRQFVWIGSSRKEIKDGSGAVLRQLFATGETISGANRYFEKDHLGSIRAMRNEIAGVEVEYSFDPFGRVSKLRGSADADFQYAGYYMHARSGLNSTATRAYNPGLGRFISRDPIEEAGGLNLYAYVANMPISFADPLGLTLTVAGDCNGDWDKARDYLMQDPVMRSIITYLESPDSGDFTINVDYTFTATDAADASGNIVWNPHNALLFTQSDGTLGYRSPALSLGHELGHTFLVAMFGSSLAVHLTEIPDRIFKNLNERVVITQYENRAAGTLNEQARPSHAGGTMKVNSPVPNTVVDPALR